MNYKGQFDVSFSTKANKIMITFIVSWIQVVIRELINQQFVHV